MSESVRILVVDDEDLARRKVLSFLGARGEAYDVAEAANGLEALDRIKAHAPQIVFLDVQMPGLTGFDVLYHLEERPFRIVFQTAYDEFAVRAFEENACDYLLKPFSRERFNKALDRALSQLAGDGQLAGLEKRLGEGRQYLTRLAVKVGGVRHMIEVDDVECFVSRDHYTCLHVGEKEYLSELSLGRLEAVLDPKQFVRVHRNAIVNTRAVTALTKADENAVRLRSGQTLTVSRRSRAKLVEALE